jgi:hypothetical protein
MIKTGSHAFLRKVSGDLPLINPCPSPMADVPGELIRSAK